MRAQSGAPGRSLDERRLAQLTGMVLDIRPRVLRRLADRSTDPAGTA